MRKKFVLFVSAAVLAVASLNSVGAASAADAGSSHVAEAKRGCVTQKEFRAVKRGWTMARVHRKFGTAGKRSARGSAGGYVSEVRTYKTCSRYSAVAVSFSKNPGRRPMRLAAKSAVWV